MLTDISQENLPLVLAGTYLHYGFSPMYDAILCYGVRQMWMLIPNLQNDTLELHAPSADAMARFWKAFVNGPSTPPFQGGTVLAIHSEAMLDAFMEVFIPFIMAQP